MWNDWLSFDVLSDLTYGESFDSLKNQKTNSFITETFTGSQFSPVVGLTWDYIFFTLLLRGLLAFQTVKNLIDGGTQTISDDKVQKRIDQGADARNDFMKYVSSTLAGPLSVHTSGQQCPLLRVADRCRNRSFATIQTTARLLSPCMRFVV